MWRLRFSCRFSVAMSKLKLAPILNNRLPKGSHDVPVITLGRGNVTFVRTSSDLFSPQLSSYFTIWFIWFVQVWGQILGAIGTIIADLMKPSIKAERARNLFAAVLLCHFIMTPGDSSASAVISLEPRQPRQHKRCVSVIGFPLALWSGPCVWG